MRAGVLIDLVLSLQLFKPTHCWIALFLKNTFIKPRKIASGYFMLSSFPTTPFFFLIGVYLLFGHISAVAICITLLCILIFSILINITIFIYISQ